MTATDMMRGALGLEQDALMHWCVEHSRFRGMRRLRPALAWSDSASASLWESRLRIFYRRQAGLPKPLVNQPIFDLEERFLGTPDLFDPEAGLATEFDGKDHRGRRQHCAKNLREEALEAANLVVCRVDSLDLRSPVPLAERLRRRYEQGRRRDRRHDAWTLNQPEWWKRRRAA